MERNGILKRILSLFLIILFVVVLFISCASPVKDKHRSSESAISAAEVVPGNSFDESTGPVSERLNIEYGHYYNRWDNDYLQIREKFDEYLWQVLRERKLTLKEDVANGIIPEEIQLEYHGIVFDMHLSTDKFENWASYVCPWVRYYGYRDGARVIQIDVDVDTLGEKHLCLQTYGLASDMHNENTNPKTADDLLAIAKEYIGQKLAKLNLTEDDFRIAISNPKNEDDSYYFSFVSNDRLLGKTEIANIKIDKYGFIRYASISGSIILDSDFAARLPNIDEKALLDEANNRFRESGCDCNLTVSYRVIPREYEGEMYAELQCAITPDNKNPETHHHDYVNNNFCVFLELND